MKQLMSEIHFKNIKFTSHLTENMPQFLLSAVARCQKFQSVQRSPGIWQTITLFENAYALPACPSYNISVRMKMNSIGGLIMTGENRSIGRKTCPSVTLSTTNITWTRPGWNSTHRHDSPATDSLSRSSKHSLIHSCLISQKTHSFSISKSNQSMTLYPIITAQCDNYMTAINTPFGQNVWAVFTVHTATARLYMH